MDLLSDEQVMSEYVLGKIVRYNNRRRLQEESVAEHTCFVTLFCLKIMAQLNLNHETERKVLILAALHDVAESRTSDIPHDVKANYPEIKSILDRIENDYYEEYWKNYLDEIQNPHELCYNILKLADTYSVLQYCLNEQSLGNNSEDIKEITAAARKRIMKYMDAIEENLEIQKIPENTGTLAPYWEDD